MTSRMEATAAVEVEKESGASLPEGDNGLTSTSPVNQAMTPSRWFDVGSGISLAERWAAWKSAAGYSHRYRPDEFCRLAAATTRWQRQIDVDLPRTFPEIKGFDEACREGLSRVLRAYANLNPEVGYCQGMNFVAGLLLLVSDGAEEEAFWMFVCLMEDVHLSGFYKEGFPLLLRYMDAFADVSEALLPDLSAHLVNEGVSPALYLQQWFLTLFINLLPMSTVLHIWDGIFSTGLHVILMVTVSILHGLKHSLLEKRFEDILDFLKTLKLGVEPVHEASNMGQLLMQKSLSMELPAHVVQSLTD